MKTGQNTAAILDERPLDGGEVVSLRIGSGLAEIVGFDARNSVKRLLPWLVAVSFFMESLDITILNTAAPTIATSLGVGPLSLKAALTSYALSLALFIPLSGWMADRFGTRRVFAAAIGTFTTGSLLCGVAQNLPMLVASRVLQGAGGAMMMPVGRIAIVRTFSKAEILRAMSFVIIPGMIGPMIGPLVGGLIVGYFHWRAIFLVNLPIGLLGLYAVRRYMPDYRAKERHPLDLVGFLLFGCGVTVLSYVLEVFGEHNVPFSSGAALLALGLGLLSLYVWHALRQRHPLLQLTLFRIRTFRISVSGGFLSRLGIGGMPFLLPLYYQVGFGYKPIKAALLIMPQPLAAMMTKIVVTHVLGRLGFRRVLRVNTIFIGLIQILFAMVSSTTPLWLIAGLAYLYGTLTSLQFTSVNTLQFADLKPAETSMGSSIGSIIQQLSLSFGVATASLVTALFLHGQTRGNVPPDALTAAIKHTFIVIGSVTILSTLLFQGLRPGDGSNVSQHREDSPETA
jgi:EmrB/QacA subfamily drug resistance transporter